MAYRLGIGKIICIKSFAAVRRQFNIYWRTDFFPNTIVQFQLTGDRILSGVVYNTYLCFPWAAACDVRKVQIRDPGKPAGGFNFPVYLIIRITDAPVDKGYIKHIVPVIQTADVLIWQQRFALKFKVLRARGNRFGHNHPHPDFFALGQTRNRKIKQTKGKPVG